MCATTAPQLTLYMIDTSAQAATGGRYKTERVSNARAAGGQQLRGPCPAHGDAKSGPNWTGWVRADSGGLGMRCHSHGCSYQAMRDALYLPQYTESYAYKDASGAPRWEYRKNLAGKGKPDKRVRMYDGRDVHPRIVGEGGSIVIVEGGKAADALASYDLPYRAAHWGGGVAALGKGLLDTLRGADVILWADADDGGRTAMARLGERLRPVAASIRVVDTSGLPDKADAADVSPSDAERLLSDAFDLPPADPLATGGAPPTPRSGGGEPDGGAPPDSGAPPGSGDSGMRWAWTSEISDMAAAARLLTAWASQLLVLWRDGGDCALLTRTDGGVWRRDSGALNRMLADAQEMFADQLPPGRRRAQLAQMCNNKARADAALSVVSPAIRRLDRAGALPQQLSQARADDLDRGRYIGTPTGVWDVMAERLLPPDEGALRLVTRMIPDPVDMSARSDLYNKLTAQTSDYTRDCLSLPLALGEPSRTMLIIEGPAGGGKSTLLAAVTESLGGYAGEVSDSVLQAPADGDAPTPSLLALGEFRLGIIEELGRKIDPTALKRITGAPHLVVRRMRSESERMRITATLIGTANPGDARIDTSAPGMFERWLVVPYPGLPESERDTRLRNADAFRGESGRVHRQALVADFLRRVARVLREYGGEFPPEPADVTAARAAMRDASDGDAGAWIREHIVPDPLRDIETGELWAAACAAAESVGLFVDGKAWGLDRRRLTERATAIHQTRPVRRHGRRYILGHRLSEAPPPPAGGAPAAPAPQGPPPHECPDPLTCGCRLCAHCGLTRCADHAERWAQSGGE